MTTAVQELALVGQPAPKAAMSVPGERLDELFDQLRELIRMFQGPETLAVDAEDARLTHDELDRRANQLARFLLTIDARGGHRIGLLFDEPVASYIAMLAVLKINAAYVPLDVEFPVGRMTYIAADAGVSMVLTLTSVRDRLPALCHAVAKMGVPLVCIDEAHHRIAAHNSNRLRDSERDAPVDDLAYIIYTSGSTGRPKGVAIDHASICNFVRVASAVYGIRPGDRMYQGMTIAFDFSVEEIWVPWLAGATLVPKPRGATLIGQDLHDFLAARQVSALCCVPTLLATLEDDLPNLRFLLVSGEACPQDLIKRWYNPERRFLNVYGPTEATVTATWSELHPARSVTIGVPLPTYSIVILDPHHPGRALPRGEVGEIGIAGIGLAREYINRPDLTARAFIPDFLGIPENPSHRIYRTGDLGRINTSGEIEYHGRADLQVKIRGYRIELTEIESVLLGVPGVAAAVVDTFTTATGSTELVGYYSVRKGAEIDPKSVYAALGDRLPSYMLPAYLEQLDTIPLTTSNKVDRRNLPPPTTRQVASSDGHTPPKNDTERLLAAELARVLGIEQVSVRDHLFDDLGADSLLVAQYVAAIAKRGSLRRPSMRDVYLNPTVRRLATVLHDPTASNQPRKLSNEEAPHGNRIPRTSSMAYLVCGAAQLALFLGADYLLALLLDGAFNWLSSAADFRHTLERAGLFTLVTFSGLAALPILAKWVLVGTWKPKEIKLWGVDYFRFWLVKALTQVSPWALFAGSPLFVLYLRALGAKIGRGVTILSRSVPVVTDLIRIGDHSTIRTDCVYTGYRAISGVIQTGSVTLGKDTHIGHHTVLDIGTSMGEGSTLGHSSTLNTGQAIPSGETWHGCPAEPTPTDYRTCPPMPCGAMRKLAYSLLQLSLVLLLAPVLESLAVTMLTSVPALASLLSGDSSTLRTPIFYLIVALIAIGLFIGATIFGLVFIMTIPRLLNIPIKRDQTYPLYGLHYILHQLVAALTNSRYYTYLFGDSSAVLHYVRVLGYNLGRAVQTGSNFGTELRHDTPYLTEIGRGTMVSDGLSVMNADYSGSSFRLRQVKVGERNFLGNNVAYPPGARTGDNCLLATKVLVPIDGPIRANTGLLGSPPFEIPRAVKRDSRFNYLNEPGELRRRLSGKNRHNTVTAALYLFAHGFLVLGITMTTAIAAALYSRYRELAIAVDMALAIPFSVGAMVALERLVLGFRRLRPQFCSIYDSYFWRHERYWKHVVTPPFPGTPFNPLIWRLAGVRIGRRVFDDGCSIPERTLVTIGDDVILNIGSTIQCHSLEDGTFKSDYTTIGAGTTLGVHAFVHYGVTVGKGSVIDANSFLMKGQKVDDGECWTGNPASPRAKSKRL